MYWVITKAFARFSSKAVDYHCDIASFCYASLKRKSVHVAITLIWQIFQLTISLLWRTIELIERIQGKVKIVANPSKSEHNQSQLYCHEPNRYVA